MPCTNRLALGATRSCVAVVMGGGLVEVHAMAQKSVKTSAKLRLADRCECEGFMLEIVDCGGLAMPLSVCP